MISISDILFQYSEHQDAGSELQFSLQLKDFAVQKGAKAVLVGPSGCGKSTLLNIIAGELVVQAGSVEVLGQDLTSMSYDQRQNFRIQNIGFIFQDFPLVPYLNSLENVLLPYRINPFLSLSKEAEARAMSLLDDVGLGAKHSRLPTQLSQGERQRVAIARALVTEPSLILADEPTAGLDRERSVSVMSLIDAMVDEKDLSLVVVTHDSLVEERYEHVLDFGSLR